ncbi:MlaD family protein [Mycobacterium talmoniae]|uniref:Lipoprotein LprN n=1 Tax=Mycobacterium talmoniae TaxID=1858794 RepID=A0A1S1NBS9_9MYCO|nr:MULTISPECIES: MlaD family protein [Mycobacterium]OHV01574.1 mammalian cell entry protein [Mycobacterium talmoniae]PQM49199.1 Lipoprotein LprN [Mycobacterium talmoniae]TDH50296.1 MCE family protein [Mycobacterium eburneum]
MIRRSSVLRVSAVLLAGLAIAAAPACSLDPTRLPVPGAFQPVDKYTIAIEFSSVLNLPARAKVDSGGVQVGVLDRVQLIGDTAVAYVDLSGDVKLPQNIRAELRQATILGDIYIALFPPEHPAPSTLRDGDTVPLGNTVPADNVEDALRSASNLVTGGAIGTLQQSVLDLNKAFPKDPNELIRIKNKLTGVLNDLAANQDTVDAILASMENISNSLAANTDTFDRLVTEGPPKLQGLSSVVLSIVQLIVDARGIGTSGGDLLNPIMPDLMQMLSFISPFVATVSTADTTIPVVADKVVALVRDKLVPFFGNGGPKYTVSEIHPPDGSLGINPSPTADELIRAMQTMGLMP